MTSAAEDLEKKSNSGWHWRAGDAANRPLEAGRASVDLFHYGSGNLRYYAPRGEDLQQPHDQDEYYIVVTGSGDFVVGDARYSFGPNDVLFVPAGAVHRFENFTEDFGTWVLFYGPSGGEAP